MNIIIIEDELASQQYLSNFLEEHFPAMEIIAIADNVPDAIAAIQENMPDILFVDVEIKMGTGFDVLEAIPEIKAEIIFTTAFNKFAINAFEYHAFDYLLKPLEDKRLKETIRHCVSRIETKSGTQQITQLLQQLRHVPVQKKRISVHTLDGIEFVDTDDILFAMAKGNYTELKLKTGNRVTLSKKLKEIEDSLPEPAFFRIHHSYIINCACVKKYYKGRGGYVMLSDETSLPVSSARKDELLKHFGE